jgi:nitrate reductase delta subunit
MNQTPLGGLQASPPWGQQDRAVDDYQTALQAWRSGRSPTGEGSIMPESFRITPALKRSPDYVAAVERIRTWTRERFGLPEDGAVLVSQVACSLPGCPPLETVIAFWTEDVKRHHFKIFKPVEAIGQDDLPPAWLKNALEESEAGDILCC